MATSRGYWAAVSAMRAAKFMKKVEGVFHSFPQKGDGFRFVENSHVRRFASFPQTETRPPLCGKPLRPPIIVGGGVLMRKVWLVSAVCMLITAVAAGRQQPPAELKVGDKAPDFSLPGT